MQPILKPVKSSDLSKDLDADKWYFDYIKDVTKDGDEIFKLTEAAHFLQIEDLLELCSARMAAEIQLMNVAEIRDYFGITNDFTPEEEEAIEKELAWVE